VVGSRHRGRIGRVLVGDVALGTLHSSPCPVAVAPRGISVGRGRPQRIGVGFDGGEESRRALRVAVDSLRAAALGLSCWPWSPTNGCARFEAVDCQQWASDYRDEQELLTQRTIDVLPVEADGEAIIGDPVEQLVALSQCVDLWVVGSRGCGPVSRILLANTPARLVRHAACPALITRAGNATGQPGEQLPCRAQSRRLVAWRFSSRPQLPGSGARGCVAQSQRSPARGAAICPALRTRGPMTHIRHGGRTTWKFVNRPAR
jgi:nucleotide-binding universal stress UspA family protein